MTPMRFNNSCSSVVQKAIDVCTPITVETVVDVEDVEIKCCDAEVICCSERRYCDTCIYEFSVRQTICVEIPLRYKTETTICDSRVDC